jgi:glycogen debranching enzyme
MSVEPLDVSDIVEIGDQYYILATSALAQHQDRVLKHDDTFALFDRFGDIKPVGRGEEGLFHQNTRFLSRLLVRVGRDRPMLLSSRVKDDNALLAIDLTNFDVTVGGKLEIQRGTVYLARTILLWDGICYERLMVRNFGRKAVDLTLIVSFDADYLDLFEVRGLTRRERGVRLPTRIDDNAAVLGYRGLDGIERRTRITITPRPADFGSGEAQLPIHLDPQAEATYWITVACELDGRSPTPLGFSTALDEVTECLQERARAGAGLYTANEQFNDWVSRSRADLALMVSDTPDGPFPYAGVPWFSAPFGRDALITSLECLWLNPDLARGVLRFLAVRQADTRVPRQDAQPGKILHELRGGEMATLGEVPFGIYYGSHDATPLFVILAAAYYERTADRAFAEWLWPHVYRALEWIERDGDLDGDGFVEYLRQSPEGLVQQGWKDSADSVWHRDGTLAEGSIALCELQGYVYAAWRGASGLARALGIHDVADELFRKAEDLQRRFDAAFWSEEMGTYALALDGQKRPCQIKTSNAGHTLFSGIAPPERAARITRTLLAADSFSGWGIRTVANTEARYNPMSYHNGSVWPHDNALIGCGMSRYGFHEAVLTLLAGLFDASQFVEIHRLPELFCGFHRRTGEGPTLYPVACAPQSWAAASGFLLLQAALGMEIRAPERLVRFRHARLPAFLEQVEVNHLVVGDAELDLAFTRQAQGVVVSVTRKRGDVEVTVVP